MDQTLRVDLIMIMWTMPRRTFRIVNQKTNQQAENLRIMPLSSNRAESKTTLSNLGLEKKPQTALTLSAHTKICFKYQQFQNNPNSPVHNSTRAASIQGEAAHKGRHQQMVKATSLDSKAAPARRYQNTNQQPEKPSTAGWERLLGSAAGLNKQG
jgi:hypothetical protein